MYKKIIVFLLILAMCMGAVSASDDSNDTIVISQADDTANQPMASIQESNISSQSLEASDDYAEDIISEDEGEFIDPSEAYECLNRFRSEEGVWQWNNDDTTKTYFNTNDTIWLQPMARDPELEETAKIRAKELAQLYDHVRPDGSDCFSAFPDNLYTMGENIAIGYSNAEGVTEAWKETNDPYELQGHRRNMLNPKFNSVGIAGYRLNGFMYWVQDFGGKYNPQEFDSSNSFKIENNTANPKCQIELPKYATGYFNVSINGKEIVIREIFQGKGEIIIYGLNAGTYEFTLSYKGDSNYKAVNRTYTITTPGDDSQTASFTYLNTLIKMADNEAKLEKDYAYDESMDSEYTDGIPLPRAITIDGQGHTIDAKGMARIFDTYDDITLKNLKLINGKSANYGGALLSRGLTIIQNCWFINNTAGLYGGAAYVGVSQLRCYDSKFIDNVAKIYGGALFGEYAISITRSSFTNNQALHMGGAVYAQTGFSSTNSNYTNNTNVQIAPLKKNIGKGNIIDDEYSLIFTNATLDNGVVNLDKNLTATQTILINASNVTINGNGHSINAKNRTKIFHVIGSNVTIRNITLSGGNALDGGAVYVQSKDITIIDVTFKDNFADTGAGITAQYNANIQSSKFIDNTASAGGGIFSDYGNITLTDCLFQNNDVSSHAGAIYAEKGYVNITKSTFTDNDALKFGGVIFTNGKDYGKVYINDCVFTNNTSKNQAGVLSSKCGAEITNSSFTNNSATNNGGVIYTTSDVSIISSNFTDNTAGNDGGAILGKNIEVKNSNFKNNDNGQVKTFSGNVAITNSQIIENDKDVTSEYIGGNNGNNGSGGNSGNTNGKDDKKDSNDEPNSNTPSDDSKKAKPKATKITAAKKTFKAKAKTKKYTITLKAGKTAVKKVKVYLKIKGKTYKATTDNKGKATFKIKLKKKGTFKTTITFKGDKNYKKSSKTVKIKLK